MRKKTASNGSSFTPNTEIIIFAPCFTGGCKYKKERMAALAELIRKHEPYFDIFLLAELWMEQDHNLLQEAAKDAGLYMTNYRELASRYIL